MKAQQGMLPGMPEATAPNWRFALSQERESAELKTMVSREEASAELTTRLAARRSLLEFTKFTLPSYRPEPAHVLMAAALDKVVAGTIRRLMIIAPPQHGKSELASVRLPAFWLGRRPDDPVIISSYGFGLAMAKSRQARDVVESAEYQVLFPGVTVHRVCRNVMHWRVGEPYRGSVLAVGTGGPITGHGAMLGIIDDPYKNWEEAHSCRYRQRAWDWYRSTFLTRIWQGGAMVLICTRWHMDDLVGSILAEAGGARDWTAEGPEDQWVVLRLPAVAETQEERDAGSAACGMPAGLPDPLGRAPGEPLCPLRYGSEALASTRQAAGNLVWLAEYQGTPLLAGGNRIERAWLKIVGAAPAGLRRVRYWDRAATEGAGCATAGVLMGMNEAGEVWVLDVIRGQWAPGLRDATIRQTAELDGPEVEVWLEQEPGSAGVDSVEATARLLAGYRVRPDKVTGDKDVRLEPLAAQAEAGRVRLVKGAWMAAFVDEMALVPNGRYRDQVDAAAGAYTRLAKTKPTGPGFVVQAADPLKEMDREGY